VGFASVMLRKKLTLQPCFSLFLKYGDLSAKNLEYFFQTIVVLR